ncbi:polyketide biosynthesis acyl carrier protein [Paenibacillus shirakamiensis]|uniref:Polyketide biosynthesis acyl carrier protein n=1 Tax=Paenibacillus shirakamiensis TaxID=1265935 RepID=A0ABS4JEP0_9BACL|nr:acyl carrier protein [Paenibacillus shirakamiensis]MBP2000180.1 polyketide biosynthesis acyl carrier protein [Paenibacillus shirakamiensis]
MSREEIWHIVIQQVIEVIPELEGYSFRPSEKLADLGANSMDRAEIVALALEALELRIPRIELFGASNIGELVELLYAKSIA